MFPPVEKLSSEQLEKIACALAALYYHFNYQFGCFLTRGSEVRYTHAVEALDLPEPYVEDALNIISCCKNEKDDCPLENDCYCYRSKRENPASF